MRKYMADFETNNNLDDCHVWAWYVCEIGNEGIFYKGVNIESFISTMFELGGVFYFHNLKFDAEFILNYLLKNGFESRKDIRKPGAKEVSTLMSRQGALYSIRINNGKTTVKLYDSLKIFTNMKVSKIAQAFDLPEGKGEIDYNKNRPNGYEPTAEEWDYIRRDVEIVSKALNFMFSQGMDKITMASNAMANYQDFFCKNFDKVFPILSIDEDNFIRESYFGGWVYLKPNFAGKIIKKSGIVLDNNSLYPFVMSTRLLPFGTPKMFEGKYKPNKRYPLYIQNFRATFKIKEGYLPTIRHKKAWLKAAEVDFYYDGNELDLTLTSVDFELFLEHYHIINIEYFGGIMFQGSTTLFTDFISNWAGVKEEATANNNQGLRTLAKYMMNSLSGKFALNPITYNKYPVYDGRIKYITDETPTERKPIYTAISSFITSYGRRLTIQSAQKNFDRFIYSDTDSLHLIGDELPEGLEIDDKKLGAWKIEKAFNKAKYLRPKSYIYHDGELHVVCAGMPADCYSQVNFLNFKINAKYYGHKTAKHVDGGIVLVEDYYTIREC